MITDIIIRTRDIDTVFIFRGCAVTALKYTPLTDPRPALGAAGAAGMAAGRAHMYSMVACWTTRAFSLCVTKYRKQ